MTLESSQSCFKYILLIHWFEPKWLLHNTIYCSLSSAEWSSISLVVYLVVSLTPHDLSCPSDLFNCRNTYSDLTILACYVDLRLLLWRLHGERGLLREQWSSLLKLKEDSMRLLLEQAYAHRYVSTSTDHLSHSFPHHAICRCVKTLKSLGFMPVKGGNKISI